MYSKGRFCLECQSDGKQQHDKILIEYFFLDDACEGVGVFVSDGREDDHLVRGAVGDTKLVTQPAEEP